MSEMPLGTPRSTYEPDPVRQLMALLQAQSARIDRLERGAPLRNASISGGSGLTIYDGGALTVYGPTGLNGLTRVKGDIEVLDADGNPRVRLGKLLSQPGVYGAEILVGGKWVPLASTAAGGSRVTVPAQYNLNANAGGNTGWVECGPTITATTYTGKLDVTVGGSLQTTGSRSTIALSYSIINANGTVVVTPDQYRAIAARHNGTGMTAYAQGEMTLSHNLTAGTYRVIGQAQTYAATVEATTASITNRTLAATGY